MKNILVFFGGTTVEHDVSIITGVMMLHAVDRTMFNPIPVYIDHSGKWFTGEILFEMENFKNLDKKRLSSVAIKSGDNKLYEVKGKRLKEICAIYSALNCMHGERGEDGSLYGTLALSNIPLASPNLVSSAISIDKYVTKKTLKGLNILTVKGIIAKSEREVEEIGKNKIFPVIIKPCSLGSSVGIECAKNREELIEKSRIVFRYDRRIVIERKLKNFIEINCSAYRDELDEINISECERPIGKDSILTFDDKYVEGHREFPANIPVEISERIREITRRIYEELNFTGIIRIDFFVKGERIYVNEINSVPGSLAYYLFCDTLKDFSKIISTLIYVSVKDFSKDSTLKRQLKTSILNVQGAKSSKRLKTN